MWRVGATFKQASNYGGRVFLYVFDENLNDLPKSERYRGIDNLLPYNFQWLKRKPN